MASTEKRDVIIKVTDKGLKEVTAVLNKLHNLITQIEAKPLKVGGAVNTSGVEKATKSTKAYAKSLSATDRAAKSVGNSSLAASKGFSKQSQGLGGLVHIYATVAANIWALGAAFDQLRQAADLRAVIQAQDELAASSGRSLKAVTKALQEGSDGALSLANSMKLANTVASAGFGANFAKDISKIAGGASKALGRDLTDSISRLTKGIAKMEPEILDELGIFVKLENATLKYAQANNRAVKDLTEFERRQAFANEATRQGIELYGDLTDSVKGNEYAEFAASLANVKDNVLGVAASVISGTGFLQSFTTSTSGAAAAIFLLVQRLTKMAIPELKNFGESFKTKSIENATKAFNEFDKVAEKSVKNTGNVQGFGVMAKGAKRAGVTMKAAFLLGASGATKNEAAVKLLNAQLLSVGVSARKAAGAMLFLGKAANGVGVLVSKLAKLAGWVAIIQVAFTALSGVVSKFLGHIGVLDSISDTFDKIGLATKLWDPSTIDAVDAATVSLSDNMEKPIQAFERLTEASKTQFVDPVRRSKVLSNIYASLQDEVSSLNTEIGKLEEGGSAQSVVGSRIVGGIDELIKQAKRLKQTDLVEELEKIKVTARPGNLENSLKKATAAIYRQAEASAIYNSKLEAQRKSVDEVNNATKRYYDSIKVSTKLDDVLGFTDTSGIDSFISRLAEVNGIVIKPQTVSASAEFHRLDAEVSKYQKRLDTFSKTVLSKLAPGKDITAGQSRALSTMSTQLAASKADLDQHTEYMEEAELQILDLNVLPTLSSEEVAVFAANMEKINEPFLRLLGLSGAEITNVEKLVKSLQSGKPVNTQDAADVLGVIRTGIDQTLKSQQKLRASALELNKIAARGATDKLRSTIALNKATNSQTLGKISKEQLAVTKLNIQLADEQVARLLKISTLKEKILQLDIDIDRATDTGTPEGEATESSLKGQANAMREQLELLKGVSGSHVDISNQLVTRLETQQALNASVRENIDMIRSQAELEGAQSGADFSSKGQDIATDQAIQPEEDFGIQLAKLEVERELYSLNTLKAEQLAEELILREELRLIEDEYLNGALLQAGSADDLAITRLTTKIANSQKLLAISKKVSAEKQKELKLNLDMAKIVSPFEKLAKALDKMDTNSFTKLAKGATKFAKVSKVNAELVQRQKDAGKEHTDQQLLGYAEQASAMGSMFDEGSKAATVMQNLENAIHIARMTFMAAEMVMSNAQMSQDIANQSASLGAKIAGGFASLVSSAGPYGLALGAGFLAIMAGLAGGGGGGGGGGNPSAGADAYMKKHQDKLGANGVSGAEELETNALTGSINDLVDIDTRLYSAMDNLQGSIVELGMTFKSAGSSATKALGGFTERGLQEQFQDLPDFGPGQGTERRPAERTLEDVLLSFDPTLAAKNIDPKAVKKASDLLAVTFGDINGLIISKLTTRKSSTGGIKYEEIEEYTRAIQGEYAEGLSGDLNSAFISTIDNTFALLQALDPSAHVGEASTAFTESIVDSLLESFSTGEFGADLETMLSVEGLSSTEAADRISIYFNGLSDDMIESIFPVLDHFRLAGEELGDALARMVTETAAAANAFSLLGFDGSIFDPSVMGEAGILANSMFQEGLFSGFSDVSAWSDLTSGFTEAILTEVELIDNKISLIESELSAGFSRSVTELLNLPEIGGLTILKAEIAFLARELQEGSITAKQAMQGLRTVWEDVSTVVADASTGFNASGDAISNVDLNGLGSLVSTIISTGEALGSLVTLQEDKSVAKAAEETGAALQDYLSVIQGLRDTISSMLLGDLSPLSKGAQLSLAKNEFDELVSAVQTEPDEGKRLELIGDLESHALDYLNASKEYYAGTGNYVSAFENVKSTLEGIEGGLQATADQLIQEDPTLGVLNSTYDLQQALADDLKVGLSDLLKALEAEESKAAAEGALGTAGKVTTEYSSEYARLLDEAPTAVANILRIYQEELGRGLFNNAGENDEVGVSWWANVLATGQDTLEGVRDGINNSVEGKAYDASQAVATGVSYAGPFDAAAFWATLGMDQIPKLAAGGVTSGISFAGEAGAEAVVPLPDGRRIPVDLGGSANNSELLEELRRIRESLDQLNATSEDALAEVVDTLADSNSLAGALVTNTNRAQERSL